MNFDGAPVRPEEITAMSRVLAHRGPDDDGVHLDGALGLGHRRLSIIDVAHGHQPMTNEDNTVWVVFNGMIYNYKPLADALVRSGRKFATNCDTEVLVHAYEEWGIKMLERLNGQFAFAIWDGKQLFMARDRMGEKPLYYAVVNETFYFASEIKSLLAHVRPQPNIPPDFFVFENTLTDDTLFQGIKELQPAHYLLVNERRDLTPRRYWSISNEVNEDLTEAEAVQQLRDLVYDAVTIRLQSEVPVGMYLSGGLDSSIIACIAKPGCVFTSFYAEPGKFDEREAARAVARQIRTEQIFVTLKPEDVPSLFENIIYHLDQPISSSSTITSFNLAHNAREIVKVVLNGQGADELFGGYGRYVLLHHEVELGHLPFFAQYTPMARRFWNSNMFGDPALRYLELNQRVSPRTSLPADTVRQLFAYHSDIVSQMGYTDAAITLQDLIKMDDRGCAHVGLESRSPFLDHRIVEFAFRLPARFKIRSGGATKWILREVAREFVPLEIVERKDKMGMVSPIGVWLRRELRSWTESLVASLQARRLDLPTEKPEDNEYDRRLHALISMELWFRRFIDRSELISTKEQHQVIQKV
ncbi:MAG: asparagine synthase (glutamine-hydrolyzing) [Nitrospirae bacterium]|nr:asparagine synthase (glutamine-hydrolyzing) [Nitrospirota bacterium]